MGEAIGVFSSCSQAYYSCRASSTAARRMTGTFLRASQERTGNRRSQLSSLSGWRGLTQPAKARSYDRRCKGKSARHGLLIGRGSWRQVRRDSPREKVSGAPLQNFERGWGKKDCRCLPLTASVCLASGEFEKLTAEGLGIAVCLTARSETHPRERNCVLCMNREVVVFPSQTLRSTAPSRCYEVNSSLVQRIRG